MGLNIHESIPIPTAQESEEVIGKDAFKAVAYLKATSNMDVVDMLGLSEYV